ncbi:hypothetical protein LSPH24S_05582 [Lysinibacillus sphaericus]
MGTEKCKTQDFGYIVYTRTNYEAEEGIPMNNSTMLTIA